MVLFHQTIERSYVEAPAPLFITNALRKGAVVSMKETRQADLIMGIIFIILGVFWFYQATQMRRVEFGIGPGGYPKFVSVVFILLGVIFTIQNISKGLPKWVGLADWKAALRVVIFAAVTFIYIHSMRTLGFILPTPFYLFFSFWFFRYQRYLIAVILSISITAAIHVVFRMIFMVMLPTFRLF